MNPNKVTVPADHRIKLTECEKKDKYLDLARELKNYGTCRYQLYTNPSYRRRRIIFFFLRYK